MTVLWLDGTRVRTAYKPSGGSFGSPEYLSTSGASAPSLKIDPVTGDALAAWIQSGNILTKSKPLNLIWSILAETLTGHTPSKVILAAYNSDDIVMWEGISGGKNVIYAATKVFGLLWGAPQIISDTQYNAMQLNSAFNGSGDLAATWFRYEDAKGNNVQGVSPVLLIRPSGSGFGAPISLGESGMVSPSFLRSEVMFDSRNNIFLAYTNSIYVDYFQLFGALFSPEGELLYADKITNPNLYLLSFSLLVDTNDNFHISYMFYDEYTNDMRVYLKSAASPAIWAPIWIIQDVVSTGPVDGFPDMVSYETASEITLGITWVSNQGGNNLVYSSVGTRDKVLPVTGLSGQQLTNQFGIFDETINELTWTDSGTSDIIHNVIQRNNAVIGEAYSGEEVYIVHNQFPEASASYTVYAVDKNGLASSKESTNVP